MRIHYVPPWIPLPAQPAKKTEKPRKFFHTEDEHGSTEPGDSQKPRSGPGDSGSDSEHTDILA